MVLYGVFEMPRTPPTETLWPQWQCKCKPPSHLSISERKGDIYRSEENIYKCLLLKQGLYNLYIVVFNSYGLYFHDNQRECIIQIRC